MEIKVNATYKKGVLILKDSLNLEENKNVEVIIKDDLYDSFSIAGEDDNAEDYFNAQKEVIENE